MGRWEDGELRRGDEETSLFPADGRHSVQPYIADSYRGTANVPLISYRRYGDNEEQNRNGVQALGLTRKEETRARDVRRQ